MCKVHQLTIHEMERGQHIRHKVYCNSILFHAFEELAVGHFLMTTQQKLSIFVNFQEMMVPIQLVQHSQISQFPEQLEHQH